MLNIAPYHNSVHLLNSIIRNHLLLSLQRLRQINLLLVNPSRLFPFFDLFSCFIFLFPYSRSLLKIAFALVFWSLHAMNRKLLLSGNRANFTTVALDLGQKKLSVLAEYAAPPNASWTELVSSRGSVDHFVGLSEGDKSGLLYTFLIDHTQRVCRITSQQPTLGAPGHCQHALL